jgi:ubiquitin C-terminal hydrolase
MTSDENASKDNNIKENKQNNKENEEGNKNDSLKKEKNNNPNNEGENQNTHPIKENEKTGESEKKNEKENKDDNKNDNGNEQKDTSKNNENPQKVDINDKKKTNNKKYKEIPIIAHESEKPSIAFEEIDAGKLYSSIPVSNSIPQNSPQDINDNNQNNASNQNNNNNIFNPELFQQFWQQYLLQHGFENNFVNNYFNLDAFMLSDEEKKIIDYYRKSENCGLPNTLNGCIILNTKNHSLGLQNVGATCYMNATLQCLIHIRELSEVLLSAFSFKYPREDINYAQNHRLSLEYINILSQVYFPKLYDASAICFAPYKFKELIGELNPLFNGYAANDAKDLLQFILETMHQELKMAVQPFMEYYCNQTQEYLAYQYFIDSYVSQNQSPLLKFLYGITKIQTECLKCKTVKYNFQSYNLLYFPLRESKWYCVEKKKQENKDFDETKYILDLDGCFMYNEKVDHFTGDNQMYCSICKGCQDSDYKSFIYSAPPILAIVLNRGRGNKDFQEPFKYSVDIDISNYLKNGQNGKYYLIGMVVHLGESSMAGHFIAYCRMDKESDWYCYNDAFVSKCSNFDEIVEKGTPYILFYRQEDQNQTQNPIQNPIQNQNQIQNQK